MLQRGCGAVYDGLLEAASCGSSLGRHQGQV